MTLLLGTVELSQHSPWSDLQFPLFCFTMENYIQVYRAYIFLRRELEKSLLQKQRTFVCRRTELRSGNPSLFLIAKTDTQMPVSSRSWRLYSPTQRQTHKPWAKINDILAKVGCNSQLWRVTRVVDLGVASITTREFMVIRFTLNDIVQKRKLSFSLATYTWMPLVCLVKRKPLCKWNSTGRSLEESIFHVDSIR